MATRTSTRKASTATEPVATEVAVQATEAATIEATVTAGKPSAFDRLQDVLGKIDKAPAKDITAEDIKWGKAIGLKGGGSVYINRSNADVRSSTKQVADWAKAGLGVARGPQGQYLRISF